MSWTDALLIDPSYNHIIMFDLSHSQINKIYLLIMVTKNTQKDNLQTSKQMQKPISCYGLGCHIFKCP